MNPAAEVLFNQLKAHLPKALSSVSTGIILGSGWGQGRFIQTLRAAESHVSVDLRQLTGWPLPRIAGHIPELLYLAPGHPLCPAGLVALLGRLHGYEGHPPQTVALPVQLMSALGISRLIVTNAAGGLNPEFTPGDWMLITDQINFTGQNPLIPERFEPSHPASTFTDMTEAYSATLRNQFKTLAHQHGQPLQAGIYVGVRGPHYETPAEVRMLRQWGGDAVGMSTVLETLQARALGIEVLGISCISNLAAGLHHQHLSHAEVLHNTQATQARGSELLLNFLAANCPLDGMKQKL